MNEHSPGTVEHFNTWHPKENYGHAFELQEMGSGGELRCFRCVAAPLDVDDPTPTIVVQAWAPSPDEAQYQAYKRAAYFIQFRVLPRPNFIAEEELIYAAQQIVHEDGHEIIREIDFDADEPEL